MACRTYEGETFCSEIECDRPVPQRRKLEGAMLESPAKRLHSSTSASWPTAELDALAQELHIAHEGLSSARRLASGHHAVTSTELALYTQACEEAETQRTKAETQLADAEQAFVAAKARLLELEQLRASTFSANCMDVQVFEQGVDKVTSACTLLKEKVEAKALSLPTGLLLVAARRALAEAQERVQAADAALLEEECKARQEDASAADAEKQLQAEAELSHGETKQAQAIALQRREVEHRLAAQATEACLKAKKKAEELKQVEDLLTKEASTLESAIEASSATSSSTVVEADFEDAPALESSEDLAAEADLKQKVAELETLCEAEAKSAMQAFAKEQIAEAQFQVAETKEVALDRHDPVKFLNARSAERLFVSTEDIPEVAGEYILLEGSDTMRPAYKSNDKRGNFLFWTPKRGGYWAFGGDLEEQKPLLARSLQLSWTALPDELMKDSWAKMVPGSKDDRQRARVVVMRW